MKLSSITKRNKKIFESKINKKSSYLRSLPKKKYEGIKKVEEGKTDLIIDKILGLGEFERNYAFFSQQTNNNEKNIQINKNLKLTIKNKLNNFFQKEMSKNINTYNDEDSNGKYNLSDNLSNYWKPNTKNFLQKNIF